MNIGSMFSGYGGLDLAVTEAIGGNVVWHMEFDKDPSRVLDHHWPGVPNHGDVTKVDWDSVEPVDVLTGGYPCQPFSHAGHRKGEDDHRHLWPYIVEAIRRLGPRLVVLENVRGHITLGFDSVLGDLAALGFDADWGIVRAADAGAPHKRERLFVLAYPSGERHGGQQDVGVVGRLGAPAEGSGWEAGPARSVPVHRSEEAAAHADDAGRAQRVRPVADAAQVSGVERGGASAADTNVAGSEAWRDGGHEGERSRVQPVGSADVAWGKYEPAIRRWEHVLGRPAPHPTEPGASGAPRLAPRFTEWMMGLEPGWVTSPDIGLSRPAQLRVLGNGVVPQQAVMAIRGLLLHAREEVA